MKIWMVYAETVDEGPGILAFYSKIPGWTSNDYVDDWNAHREGEFDCADDAQEFDLEDLTTRTRPPRTARFVRDVSENERLYELSRPAQIYDGGTTVYVVTRVVPDTTTKAHASDKDGNIVSRNIITSGARYRPTYSHEEALKAIGYLPLARSE